MFTQLLTMTTTHKFPSLEVVVTGVAEVGRPEAEEDGHRAAVAALVLQVVRAVLRAHLGLKDNCHGGRL